MNDAREKILGRVRQALKTSSPEPHWQHEPVDSGPVFPVPNADDEPALRERFREEFKAIQGEIFEPESVEEGIAYLRRWFNEQEITSVLALDDSLRQLLGDVQIIEWLSKETGSEPRWEQVDVGMTRAESLVAESGSILVSSASAGRAVSVLPPIHLVLASADQLVPDIDTSMERLRERYGDLPTSFSWISGPSRTADIEKILVLGAHGPRRLILVLFPAGALPK